MAQYQSPEDSQWSAGQVRRHSVTPPTYSINHSVISIWAYTDLKNRGPNAEVHLYSSPAFPVTWETLSVKTLTRGLAFGISNVIEDSGFYGNVRLLLSLLSESLSNILVVVKSLGMGFHLPVDGIRSLSLVGSCSCCHSYPSMGIKAAFFDQYFRQRYRTCTGRTTTSSPPPSIMGTKWLTRSASRWVDTKSSCRDAVPVTFTR